MEQGSMRVKKESLTEFTAKKGYSGFIWILKQRLTPEEFSFIDPEGNITLDLPNTLFLFIGNILKGQIKDGIPEIEMETSIDFDLKEDQSQIANSSGPAQIEILKNYIDDLIVKIAFKLSTLGVEKSIEVLKKVITFDKDQVEKYGEFFNALRRENRIFEDTRFLVELEKSL